MHIYISNEIKVVQSILAFKSKINNFRKHETHSLDIQELKNGLDKILNSIKY